MSAPRERAPRSTYRLQITADFTLHDAAGLADYLQTLGVTHAYTSPLLAATPGSGHGYDTIAFDHVDPERGGEEGFAALDAALRGQGLGLVVDIVPNHTGVASPEVNPWWWDVLRHGRASEHAAAFDVEWDLAADRIRLPVLAAGTGALDDLSVQFGELRYFDHRFPLAAGSDDADSTPAQVHDRQHYELVDWRRADTDLNYRRFFAISDLAALRVELPEVFDTTHALILKWVRDGSVQGLRIDHPDGLADPGGYLQRLAQAAPGVWIVVEKILQPGESLPPSWPVAGTTGYDALNEVLGVFLDPRGEGPLTDLDTELAGGQVDFPAMEHQLKRGVADGILNSEVRRLARLVPDLPQAPDALAELLASFPVYRSYVPFGAEHLQRAHDAAAAHRPDLAATLTAMHGRLSDPTGELAIRFQQTSGMVMAKGVEDTAFYQWARMVALNEVGGDPTRFGVSVGQFHALCGARLAEAPLGMTTLSTHDTKRSEDVRARLAVLAEIPEAWAGVVRQWNA
nr:malto-oligosyltrehalose synthase [Geodermatophilaceae bacterium]